MPTRQKCATLPITEGQRQPRRTDSIPPGLIAHGRLLSGRLPVDADTNLSHSGSVFGRRQQPAIRLCGDPAALKFHEFVAKCSEVPHWIESTRSPQTL